MSRLRVLCFSLSIDGFAAGPEQSLENPNGLGGLDIHEWLFPTATFQQLLRLYCSAQGRACSPALTCAHSAIDASSMWLPTKQLTLSSEKSEYRENAAQQADTAANLRPPLFGMAGSRRATQTFGWPRPPLRSRVLARRQV